jgi:transposase-like protein
MVTTKNWQDGEPKAVHQMTLKQFDLMFPDEEACKVYLVAQRWPSGVRCPRCGNEKVYWNKTRPFTWQCTKCGAGKRKPYRFSLYVGTIFENTNYPLRTWFRVLHLMLTSKKGISALQIHRMIGSGSYRTAWFMCHRLRAGMHDPDFRKLMGIVEIDETFVGGKEKNKHLGKRNPHNTAGKGKAVVIGAISRKGNVVCKMIEKADRATMMEFVRKAVDRKVELVVTDEHKGYDTMVESGRPHEVIKHGENEYVRGIVHTNSIEGFWSLFKRGVMGSYHKVSAKYLPLYLAEFQFRFNNRHNPDIFGAAVREC